MAEDLLTLDNKSIYGFFDGLYRNNRVRIVVPSSLGVGHQVADTTLTDEQLDIIL